MVVMMGAPVAVHLFALEHSQVCLVGHQARPGGSAAAVEGGSRLVVLGSGKTAGNA